MSDWNQEFFTGCFILERDRTLFAVPVPASDLLPGRICAA